MLSRRHFLGISGAGLLALSSGCRPQHIPGLLDREKSSSLNNISLAEKAQLQKLKNYFLGYPINMNTPDEAFFEWRRKLVDTGIGAFAYNNVGNPYKESAIPFNTHDFEREIINKFAKLYGFPVNNTWGFISNSGTDSNMHGMYIGRTLLKGKAGVVPKAYFTKEAHYSVQILRDLLGLETMLVDTLPDGGMDPDDLKNKVSANPNHPALVVATIGTTFKGAIDRLDQIQQALKDRTFYLHLDAALFGGYLPFTSHAEEVLYRSQNSGNKPRYHSIAVSCHKFFGSPSPAGLFITTASAYEEFNALFSQIHNPEYIHHVPGTITCSRDAVKPAEFYYFSTPEALSRLTEDARMILDNTTYLMDQMQNRYSYLQPTRVNPLSNTIYFKTPGSWVVKKYSLATMHLDMNGVKQEHAHVVIMPHVNRTILSEFLDDLGKNNRKES